MVGIIIDGVIKTFPSLPKTWKNYLNFPEMDSQVHYDEGFRNVIIPDFNPDTEYLGEIFLDEEEDVFTYTVESRSIEEIQADILRNARNGKDILINQIMRAQIEAEAQEEENDDIALENQAIYPIWTYPFYYTVGFKCQHFNDENELVLYKTIQEHESQENWQPKDVPAMFVRIAHEGEILDWVQPIGNHDAYQIGDKVNHNGDVWISIVDSNVWEPGVYGWEIFVE